MKNLISKITMMALGVNLMFLSVLPVGVLAQEWNTNIIPNGPPRVMQSYRPNQFAYQPEGGGPVASSYSYNQTASVSNAVPQLPRTGGGGKYNSSVSSSKTSVFGNQTITAILLEMSAGVALILIVIAMLVPRNKEDNQLAI